MASVHVDSNLTPRGDCTFAAGPSAAAPAGLCSSFSTPLPLSLPPPFPLSPPPPPLPPQAQIVTLWALAREVLSGSRRGRVSAPPPPPRFKLRLPVDV